MPARLLGAALQLSRRRQEPGPVRKCAGELSDAASALDWLQAHNREAKNLLDCRHLFGAWISMQLLMRRPEISGFISVAPLAKHYDSRSRALARHRVSSSMRQDTVTPPEAVNTLVTKLKTQKGIVIEHKVMQGAQPLLPGQDRRPDQICATYLDKKMAPKPEAGQAVGIPDDQPSQFDKVDFAGSRARRPMVPKVQVAANRKAISGTNHARSACSTRASECPERPARPGHHNVENP